MSQLIQLDCNPVTDRKGVDHRTGICRQVETGAERLSEEEGGR